MDGVACPSIGPVEGCGAAHEARTAGEGGIEESTMRVPRAVTAAMLATTATLVVAGGGVALETEVQIVGEDR